MGYPWPGGSASQDSSSGVAACVRAKLDRQIRPSTRTSWDGVGADAAQPSWKRDTMDGSSFAIIPSSNEHA